MKEEVNWDDAKSILCIRLDNLGDVLMTTPAMHALGQSGTDRRITLLASHSGAAIAPYLRDVDECITYDAAWVKNDSRGNEADIEMIAKLRERQFDAAVIFTVYSQNPLPAALMCHLAGIPRVLAHCRENPYRLLSSWLKESEPAQQVRHEVQRQLDLVAHVGACSKERRLSLETRASDHQKLRIKLAARGLPATGAMVVHCGATAPSRRYPAAAFAQALSLIGDRAGPVVLTGTKEEQALAQSVAAACSGSVRVTNLAGQLSLGEFACLIQRAALLLSNNTGPVHMAAALGTPVVTLYALTNPQHTPWMVPHRLLFHDVPCKYCYRSICPQVHHDCLTRVPPMAVRDAVLDLLSVRGRVLENIAC